MSEEHWETTDVVILYNELGILYGAQGKLYEAEQLVLKVLRLARLVWGKEQPEMASCYQNLAPLYTLWEKYEEAEELLKKIILEKEMLGKNHKRTIETMDGLKYVRTKLKEKSKNKELVQKR